MGKHTRVSLLLQANFQGQDGRARLVREGPVARGSRVPGTITLFEHGAERSHAVVATKFEQAEERPLNYSAHQFGTDLGDNLYRRARDGLLVGVEVPTSSSLATSAGPAPDETPAKAVQVLPNQPRQETNEAALAGLDLLSRIVGAQAPTEKTFKLMLFAETAELSPSAPADLHAHTARLTVASAESNSARLAALRAELEAPLDEPAPRSGLGMPMI